jgi:hypothetical protein
MNTSRDSYSGNRRPTNNTSSRKSFASNSPNRLIGWRPSTYIGAGRRDMGALVNDRLVNELNYRGYYRGHLASMSQIRIMQEVNGEEIKDQDKDIEIERLQTTCASLNNKASIAEDQGIEIDVLKKRLMESEELRDMLKKCNDDLEQERVLNEKIRQQQEHTINQLEKDRADFEKRRQQQEAQLATQERRRVSQDEHIDTLENQCQAVKSDLQVCLAQKAKLQSELDTATEYIITMEEKVYKSNKISLELLEQVKECEIELGQMPYSGYAGHSGYGGYNDYRSGLGRAYAPAGSDTIDQRMSEFINSHPERQHLRLLFVREGEGWYSFGTKRVNVKAEGNALKVRVGGGYTTIDDYVDQNLPFEVARLNADLVGRADQAAARENAKINAAVNNANANRNSNTRNSLSPDKNTGKADVRQSSKDRKTVDPANKTKL